MRPYFLDVIKFLREIAKDTGYRWCQQESVDAVSTAADKFQITTNTAGSSDHDLRSGALVYWSWEETHVPKVVGLNPGTVYWMDIFHLYLF